MTKINNNNNKKEEELKMTKINNNNNKKEEELKMTKIKFWEQEAKEAKRALRIINLQIGNSSKMADLRLLEQRNGELAWMLNEAGDEEEAEIFLKRAEYYKNLQEEVKNKNIKEVKDKKEEELKMTKINNNNNNKKEEEIKMTKNNNIEESVKRWQRERFENDKEQIKFQLEYCAEQYDYIEDVAFDDVEEVKLKSELIQDVADTIHGIDIYEEGDLGRDIEVLMEWFKRSKAQVERLVQRFKDDGSYYEGPAYHKASPYELR